MENRWGREEGCYPGNWQPIKRVLWKKLSKWSRKKISAQKIPYCSTLEVYDKTPIFIPVEVMEDVVESFTQKLSEVSSPIGTDSAALQGWI